MKPSFLAVIPARGGSKGVPRKNVRDLNGKPLIAWTIEEAKKSQYISNIILSSEDSEIIKEAKKYGCEVPFIRPMKLAQDDTPGIDPVLHAINQCPGYDYVVLLQPTSPLRKAEDIDGAIQMLLDKGVDYCVSVTEPDKSPYWMYKVDNNGHMEQIIDQDNYAVRRQDLPNVFSLNGAVYVAQIESLKNTKSFLNEETVAFKMPRSRSMDIDTEEDFLWCEWLLSKKL
ncbi:cytidylyltransferase domain-containing protein [Psychrobacillus sp. FJAT-21963]|uniref:acylneuraminate cytidylyltransferase family protein n=1 Tax=Psychrobacillus sp. FJAT-21963 TaxID=1712028 RepID=UPI0006F66510|nr:acylneuraminate cytidylyltransferase family protein [Psychrobacillus sp. FJAT-21963]KQL36746.1 acylneuraminate cytidylyltransferase [Psychrobacillus sp. FJAT-21963]